MALALGLGMKVRYLSSLLASVYTTGLIAWHKFTATSWSGSNRLPDSSPVATNTASLNTGRGYSFDGVNDVITIGATGATIKTLIFYVNPDTSTQVFLQLQSTGAVRVQVAAGVLLTTGFTVPTTYVNGVASSTVSASAWQMIVVTTATGVAASNLLLGQSNTSFYAGKMSNVKMFTTELNSTQIAELYANPEQTLPTGSTAADLAGWWSLAEGSANTVLNGVAGGVGGILSGATLTTAAASPAPQWAVAEGSVPMCFDGVNDYAAIADANSLDIASGDNFTISALVYIPSIPADNTIFGIYNKNNYSDNGFFFGLRNAGLNGVGLRVYTGGSSIDFKPASNVSSSIANKLVMLTVRRNGTTLDLFVDATKYTSATSYAGYNLTNALEARIGMVDTGTGGPWNGCIFWTAFWLTNVSDSDISAMATRASLPSAISAASLKLYMINRGNSTTGWRDESGNANHATSVGGSPALLTLPPGTTSGKDVAGIAVGVSAGTFIGNGGSYATISDVAGLDLTSAITLEAWVKPYTVAVAQTIIGKNGSYALGITSAGKPVFTKWTSTTPTATATTTTAVTANTWTHLAATYDGTNVKLYINGVLNTTTGVTGAMDATSANVLLGAKTTSTELFTGLIDSAKIYSAANTAAQILANKGAENSQFS